MFKRFVLLTIASLFLLSLTSCYARVSWATPRRPAVVGEYSSATSQRLWNICYPHVARWECDSAIMSPAYVSMCMAGLESEFWAQGTLHARKKLLYRYGCPARLTF